MAQHQVSLMSVALFSPARFPEAINPNSEVGSGEHTRPRVWRGVLRTPPLRATLPGTFGMFLCARVFREGAENCARGRARSLNPILSQLRSPG